MHLAYDISALIEVALLLATLVALVINVLNPSFDNSWREEQRTSKALPGLFVSSAAGMVLLFALG